MCGIIGYIGNREAADVLLDGLKRLEYRGYDSAGIAVLNGGAIAIERSEGKLTRLEARLRVQKPSGRIGIGHTRWATHGIPSEKNAHPHRVGEVAVVHNGIIENHVELHRQLTQKGCRFVSETDTEIFCHLIHQELKRKADVSLALRRALEKVRGTYALVVLHAAHPDRLIIAKKGSPLVVGFGKGENLVASDVGALLPYTREVVYLEDGEIGTLTPGKIEIQNGSGMKRPLRKTRIDWNPLMAEKGGYKHFMLKEIFEQPHVVEDTLMGRIQPDSGRLTLEGVEGLLGKKGFPFREIALVACGTSWHAAQVGKYWIEGFARIPVSVHLASEYRYCHPIVDQKTLFIPISQSGETADTLAAAQLAKERKAKVLAICNVLGSSLARLAHAVLYTHAGPEIGVASTKAFVAQLTVLYLLTVELARRQGKVKRAEMIEKIERLREVPRFLKRILKNAPAIRAIAERCAQASHFLFIGRGPLAPVALEGALKLKEIAYVHAEGFAAGELKHGPIALIEEGVPVVALAPRCETFEKILSNIEEVKARGAYVIGVGETGDKLLAQKSGAMIDIPKTKFSLTPLLYSVPLQLFAYYIACHKGTDVDQPRNLAKSVTVE